MDPVPLNPQPAPVDPSMPHEAAIVPDWVATVAGLQRRLPFLGSTANINRLLKQKDGLPYQYLGGRLIFHVPTILEWVKHMPGKNLPFAS